MKFIERLVLSLFIALPVLLMLLFLTQTGAQADTPQTTPQPSDCAACHAEFQSAWQTGDHAQASQNEAFTRAWAAQGQPTACLNCHAPGYDAESATGMESGVTCTVCHGLVQPDHPKQNMVVDASAEACAKCHSDPRFGGQWTASAHYQTGIACTTCHDPHTNGFQTPPGAQQDSQNPSTLCQNCHKDIAATAEHSKHAAANVACVDCHLGVRTGDASEPHATPNHTFKPTLDSCNACHTTQMHARTGAPVALQTPAPANTGTLRASFLSTSPAPVNPFGYVIISVLIGLACGFALAPLIERSSRRRRGGK
jgi:cytochrome c554/c'-like protein/doubled CXXCH motif protein